MRLSLRVQAAVLALAAAGGLTAPAAALPPGLRSDFPTGPDGRTRYVAWQSLDGEAGVWNRLRTQGKEGCRLQAVFFPVLNFPEMPVKVLFETEGFGKAAVAELLPIYEEGRPTGRYNARIDALTRVSEGGPACRPGYLAAAGYPAREACYANPGVYRRDGGWTGEAAGFDDFLAPLIAELQAHENRPWGAGFDPAAGKKQ